MGVNPDWGILQQVDVGGNFQRAFKQGQEARRERETRNALQAFAKDPTSQEPINALLSVNPSLAFQLQSKQRETAAYNKNQAFEGALGKFYQSRRGDPTGSAIVADVPGVGQNNPITGQASAPAMNGQPPMQLPVTPDVAQSQFGGGITPERLDTLDPAGYSDALESINTFSQLIQIADNPGKW